MPRKILYISVFQQDDADHYKLLAKVQSTLDARTAVYFGKGRKGLDRFYLAVPARADHGAEVWSIPYMTRVTRQLRGLTRFHSPENRMAFYILQGEVNRRKVVQNLPFATHNMRCLIRLPRTLAVLAVC